MKLAYIGAVLVGLSICSFGAKVMAVEISETAMNGKRVLLVVGEPSRKAALAARLQHVQFVVNAVDTGEAALDVSRQQKFDIAVVDFSLPTLSGTAVVSALRAENGNSFPILVLTDARTGWHGEVEVAKAGADQTLHELKNAELETQVVALLRRWNQPTTICGPIRLDNRTQTAEFGERRLDLTAFEYKVLDYLVAHQGQWTSGGSIVEHLYQQEYNRGANVENVVAEFVDRLRKKMDPDGTRHSIEISDQGYRIACR